jgi:hypothetical protein
MRKKLTAILLAGAAAAVPVSAPATSGHPHPGSERVGPEPGVTTGGSGALLAGSKPGVASGSIAQFVGSKPGVASGGNALFVGSKPGIASGSNNAAA